MPQMMPKSSYCAAPKLAERERTVVTVQVVKIPQSQRCIVRFNFGSADLKASRKNTSSLSARYIADNVLKNTPPRLQLWLTLSTCIQVPQEQKSDYCFAIFVPLERSTSILKYANTSRKKRNEVLCFAP